MNIEIRQKGEETTWEELVNLFHESFQERLDQGLHFSCSYFTPEDLERRSANNVVLVATDKDTGALVGTASVEIVNDEKGTWGYFSNMAISPKFKRCGIGSKLVQRRIEIAKANGCSYVISDTAMEAKSSVNWHRKNGFVPFTLHSFQSTNYYSVIFRKQLQKHWLWSNKFFCHIHFLLSSVMCRLYRHKDASLTTLGKVINKLRN